MKKNTLVYGLFYDGKLRGIYRSRARAREVAKAFVNLTSDAWFVDKTDILEYPVL